ncbi:NPC intracellular cholesterol transporter 1-like [Penaeus monodon]|uniref:NPC intracellular cholesterol transporter 1-like n=1 Tax=Penaeus monodon TaxID=6687 RepID=UPI0018A7C497|nr:NPC intracellular cholesterol transporter 1-like [Penaeus monodon]
MQDRLYFDSHFGPAHRTAQLILTPKNYDWFNVTMGQGETYRFGPALNTSFLLEAMALQGEVEKLTATFEGQSVGLKDVCVKPKAPQADDCLIHSALNYWQNDPDRLQENIAQGVEHFAQHLVSCVKTPMQMVPESCLGSFGGPVAPYTSLGGFLKEGEVSLQEATYTEATALIVTLFLEAASNESALGAVLEWEKTFLTFLQERSGDEAVSLNMDVAFTAERGAEDEHVRASEADLPVFLGACLAVAAYAALGLGGVSAQCKRLFIDSKLGLALGAAVAMLASAAASVACVSYLGVATTAFVVQLPKASHDRKPPKKRHNPECHPEAHPGRAFPDRCSQTNPPLRHPPPAGRSWGVGFITSFGHHVAFALVLGFLLQMTCFVALLALDARRIESHTWDLCCIIQGEASAGRRESNVCYVIFHQLIGPFIFKDLIRVVVLLLFTGAFFASVSFTNRLEIGMERNVSVPEDSFLHKFYKQQDNFLAVGPPVYFTMTEGYNFTDFDEQNLVCQFSGCRDDSMLQVIYASSMKPEMTYLATEATSWISPYFAWLRDFTGSGFAIGACCRLDADGNFINTSDAISMEAVATCLQPDDFISSRPRPSLFMRHLGDFLSDNPHDSMCPVAGHVSFGDSVEILEDRAGYPYVGANYFVAYSARLGSSWDRTCALSYAQKLGENLTWFLQENSKFTKDVQVFPYSSFYVYYEQYLTMWTDTGVSLGVSVASVFGVMLLLTFDLTSSAVVLLTIAMIVVDMMGMMFWWGISLNAVSLVNLVMTVGVSVELCCHISYSCVTSRQFTKLTRAQEALATVGSSVFSGITLAMACGIAVLGYAQSQLFKMICLPMFTGMLVIGASHGLIFLPVLLSLCGPKMNRVLANEKQMTKHKGKSKNNKNEGMATEDKGVTEAEGREEDLENAAEDGK